MTALRQYGSRTAEGIRQAVRAEIDGGFSAPIYANCLFASARSRLAAE